MKISGAWGPPRRRACWRGGETEIKVFFRRPLSAQETVGPKPREKTQEETKFFRKKF